MGGHLLRRKILTLRGAALAASILIAATVPARWAAAEEPPAQAPASSASLLPLSSEGRPLRSPPPAVTEDQKGAGVAVEDADPTPGEERVPGERGADPTVGAGETDELRAAIAAARAPETPGDFALATRTSARRGGRAAGLSIPYPADNELVGRYITQYTSPDGLRWLQTVMRRAAPYRAFIENRIKERGLPPELVYLPVIESSYSSVAVSRSGAAGLWQFMTNSIAPFGIAVNDWVDERRDFWKATDGALRKLEENYAYFGDWALALAAYNAGLGAVKRAADASGLESYWELCDAGKLKRETIHYVPKFLAIASVLSRAGAWGVDLGWPEDPEWTRVTVPKPVDLDLLAQKSGVPLETLRVGNRELRYGITPPASYSLKVPAAWAKPVTETLNRRDLQLLRYYIHVVQYGDTLSALSRHYGVSVDFISRTNGGLDPRKLRIGSKLAIPALHEVGPYMREEKSASELSFDGSYVVRKGDTLWSIALAFEVDPEVLAQANGLELSSILREGRTLKTPILNAGSR